MIFLSGDDAEAKAAVAELFDAAGFFAIDLGDLIPGGRMQQIGGPRYPSTVRLPPVEWGRRQVDASGISVGQRAARGRGDDQGGVMDDSQIHGTIDRLVAEEHA